MTVVDSFLKNSRLKKYALPGKAEKNQTLARVRTYNLLTGRRTPYQLGQIQ